MSQVIRVVLKWPVHLYLLPHLLVLVPQVRQKPVFFVCIFAPSKEARREARHGATDFEQNAADSGE
ncbi:hypothetical protein E2C01_074580 [Portunus trituberculatus]|uniref:Uncharacterized protein n=1 Tax=Portunus trituberculatus TaxID=210409 RepID=A0A5B7IEN1_PORTR|nr:hypothetical protein [Portunus trituberculatus]